MFIFLYILFLYYIYEACGHDAFSFSRQEKHFYTFPQFSCIPQVVNKIELESATGILVVSLFTT